MTRILDGLVTTGPVQVGPHRGDNWPVVVPAAHGAMVMNAARARRRRAIAGVPHGSESAVQQARYGSGCDNGAMYQPLARVEEHPKAVEDAPPAHVSRQLQAILGVEIPTRRIAAAATAMQDRQPDDVEGIVAGLSERSEPDRRLAELIGRYLGEEELQATNASAGSSPATNLNDSDGHTRSPSSERPR